MGFSEAQVEKELSSMSTAGRREYAFKLGQRLSEVLALRDRILSADSKLPKGMNGSVLNLSAALDAAEAQVMDLAAGFAKAQQLSEAGEGAAK